MKFNFLKDFSLRENFFSIRGKVFVFSLSISLLPIIFLALFFYQYIKKTNREDFLNTMLVMAESKKEHVKTVMDIKKNRTMDFGSDGFIIESLSKMEKNEKLKENLSVAIGEHLRKNKIPLDSNLESMSIVDQKGRLIASSYSLEFWQKPKTLGDVELIEKVLKQTRETREVYWGLPHTSLISAREEVVFSFYTPLFSDEKQKPIGVLINSFKLNFLSVITTNRKGLGKTGEVYLVDKQNQMLTESRFIQNAIYKQNVNTLATQKVSKTNQIFAGVYSDYRGISVMGVSVYLPEYEWFVIAEIDEDEALDNLKMFYLIVLVVSVLCILIVTGLGILFAAYIDVLVKETHKLSVAVELGPNSVTVTDYEGNIQYVNPAFEKNTGYTKKEVVGKNPRLLSSGRHSKEFFQKIWETIKSGKVWHGEIINKNKDGAIIYEDTTITPVWDNDNKITHFMALKLNITARKLAAMELIEKNKKLEFLTAETIEKQNTILRQSAMIASNSKMTALGEMAGGVAHEINNPLGIILGKASQLLKHVRSGTSTNEMMALQLEKIIATSQRIAKIVRGLRSFSRNGENDPFVLTNVKEIINNVLDLCSERFKKNDIAIKIVSLPDISISCQAVQLEQVLLNLLNNSYDAVESLVDRWIRIQVEVLGEKVQISVTDSGAGISSHVAEKLMQPFFTTKEVGKGTGLGLSISKGIVEAHGGKFWLDRSSLNTRFIMELPLGPVKKVS